VCCVKGINGLVKRMSGSEIKAEFHGVTEHPAGTENRIAVEREKDAKMRCILNRNSPLPNK